MNEQVQMMQVMEHKMPGVMASIAICDDEFSYAGHLAEYLRNNTNIPYETQLYSSAERLLQMANPMGTMLLVIAESEYSEVVAAAGYRQILILQESDVYPDTGGVLCVSKYQSMETLSATILSLCMAEENPGPARLRHGAPMHIVGFYTPISRALQTTCALTLGEMLSENYKTLYLNLERYSGLASLLGRSFRGTLSELIYYNDCARDRFASRLSMMVENIGGLDVVPPMRSFKDLNEVSGEELLCLLESVERLTEYEYLILDLSEVNGLFELLRCCERVITVTRSDAVSEAKMAEYKMILRQSDAEDILTRTRQEELPLFAKLPADYLNLGHGPLAEYLEGSILHW